MDREIIKTNGKEAIKIIQTILKKGNATKIVIKDTNGKQILHVPLTLLAITTWIAPLLTGLGVGLALIKKCVLEIEYKKSPNARQKQKNNPEKRPENKFENEPSK